MDIPLTPPQRVLAAVYLRRYLESCLSLDLPFKLYTFRSVLSSIPRSPDSLPDGGSRPRLHPTADRRSSGSTSDPTGDQVVILCDGVEVVRRERIEIPAAQMRQLLQMLPSHLEQVATSCFLDRKKQEVVAATLGISHSTVSRRLKETIAELCSSLYGSRWAPAAALAPTSVDDYPISLAGDGSILQKLVG